MGNKYSVFSFADIRVHEREFSLVKAGEVLAVEPKTFRVLLFLLRNPQKLITKDELLNAVWGDIAVGDNSLARSIALLRRLLGDETRNPRYIETVATVGYRFLCPVEISEEASGNIEANGATNDRSGDGAFETALKGRATEAAATKATGWRTQRFRLGWLLAAIIFVFGLVSSIWYLRRPLRPLRVTGYTQITHDGLSRGIAGVDGSRLYFNQFFVGQSIAEVAISGGEIVRIPVTLHNPYAFGVSPNGSALLVVTNKGEKGLWEVQVPGGSARLLKDTEVNAAAWSPDGESVAYNTTDGDIYVMKKDGTGASKLTSEGGKEGFGVDIRWSPDGRTIRINKDATIWQISSDGTNLHQLLPAWHASDQGWGRWTPDGKFYVFSSGDQIWALDERRGLFRRSPITPVQLTSGPIRWSDPIPSKDGKMIFANGSIRRNELVRFSQQQRLEPWLGGISAWCVSFSANGQFVAYVNFPESSILWRANKDGSNAVQLTGPLPGLVNPRWSPDGTQIVFFQTDWEGHTRSYIISSRGGKPEPLLPEDKEPQSDPDWSPDGRKIVFTTVGSETSTGVVRILDLASHQIVALAGSQGIRSPRWSPNGRWIAGITSAGLKVFSFDMRRWSELQKGTECDWPVWSRDGQFIYYYSMHGEDDKGVYRVRVSGGTPERVVDLKGFGRIEGIEGYMGLDPQDAPILLQDKGRRDTYALTLEEK